MGSSRVSLVFLLCACSGGGGTEPNNYPWTVVWQGQSTDPSALSTWASSGKDVWVVGGDARTGSGPLVEHYDGTTWTKLDSGLRNIDLWWVFGFANGPVFMSGSNGTIVKYDNGTFAPLVTPSTGGVIVFGMWGAAADDLWAVGGNLGGASGGFAWHYDGTTWTASSDVPADIASEGTIFKIGGRSSTDIWMCGVSSSTTSPTGTTLHYDGTTLDRTDLPIDGSLFSVAGNSERFITVGGFSEGVIYENEGSGWVSQLGDGQQPLTGVAVSEDQAYAVGQLGTILDRNKSWAPESGGTSQDLHAAFIDPDGGVWATGGMFNKTPTTDGVLVYKGPPLSGAFQ